MVTSRGIDDAIRNGVSAVCWGVWSELGVSGWGRTHQSWGLDPEPLIIFTASFGDRDPRLRNEALDWCIRNVRIVSQIRLRNILRLQSDATKEAWGQFAATVSKQSGIQWPGSTEPMDYAKTGKSVLRSFVEPSMVILRMRAIFGISARTEILRSLMFGADHRATAAMLSETTNYAKRNVANACDSLLQAGMLTTVDISNRFYYTLAKPHATAEFIGNLPAVVPNWIPLLRALDTLMSYTELAENQSDELRIVLAHTAWLDMEKELTGLGIAGPSVTTDEGFLQSWDTWTKGLMDSLATGTWPGNDSLSTKWLTF